MECRCGAGADAGPGTGSARYEISNYTTPLSCAAYSAHINATTIVGMAIASLPPSTGNRSRLLVGRRLSTSMRVVVLSGLRNVRNVCESEAQVGPSGLAGPA